MYILADVGGTNMRVSGSADLQTFEEPVIIDTPQNHDEGIACITDVARRIAGGKHIEAVVVGLPGVISHDRTSLVNAHNLHGWDGHNIAKEIQNVLSTVVYLENDAALVGLGEAVYGAGAGIAIVTYITVSTGVNGARMTNGNIDRTAYGFEIGDQYVTVDGKPRLLGDTISGKAVSEKYGKKPKELGKESPVWEELAEYMAYGLNNAIVHWSPDQVILGGSMFNEIGIPIDRVIFHLERILTKYPTLPEIVHSKLGDVGGLYGGMARLKHFSV